MKKHDVDEIILVGGSARIPKIQQRVKDFFYGLVRLILTHPIVQCKHVKHKLIHTRN